MRYLTLSMTHLILAGLLAAPSLIHAQTIHEVTVMDNQFSPPIIQIAPGDTVRWVDRQNDSNYHNVESEDSLWTPPPVGDGWTFEHSFNDEGNFGYFCNPHRAFGMDGVVQVIAGTAVDLNPGHNGNWWSGPGRSGEGAQVEISSASSSIQYGAGEQLQGTGDPYVFVATFYSYAPDGGQIFLIAVGTPVGETVDVDVFITDGPVWGSGFDPNDVNEVQWGVGFFESLGCDLMAMILTPNSDFMSLGYTLLAYDLVRLTTSSIPCPY